MRKAIICTLMFFPAITINAQEKQKGIIEIGETVSIKSTVLNTDKLI